MKNSVPTSIIGIGQRSVASAYVGLGHRIISSLREDMAFQRLKIGVRRFTTADGVRILATVTHNLSEIRIDATQYSQAKAIAAEDREAIVCKDTIILSPDNPVEILANSSDIFTVVDYEGDAFEVTLTGGGFFLDAALSLQTETFQGTDVFTIYTGTPCGTCDISVSDICYTASAIITSPSYIPPTYDTANSADIIADNSSGQCYILDGYLPITVSIVGSGFWLDPTHTIKSAVVTTRAFYIYTAVACGTGKITVTDDCGTVVSGGVRSVNGVWGGKCYYVGYSLPYPPGAGYYYLIDQRDTCNFPFAGGIVGNSTLSTQVSNVSSFVWKGYWAALDKNNSTKLIAEFEAALLNIQCRVYHTDVETPPAEPTGPENTCDPANPCEWIC